MVREYKSSQNRFPFNTKKLKIKIDPYLFTDGMLSHSASMGIITYTPSKTCEFEKSERVWWAFLVVSIPCAVLLGFLGLEWLLFVISWDRSCTFSWHRSHRWLEVVSPTQTHIGCAGYTTHTMRWWRIALCYVEYEFGPSCRVVLIYCLQNSTPVDQKAGRGTQWGAIVASIRIRWNNISLARVLWKGSTFLITTFVVPRYFLVLDLW